MMILDLVLSLWRRCRLWRRFNDGEGCSCSCVVYFFLPLVVVMEVDLCPFFLVCVRVY